MLPTWKMTLIVAICLTAACAPDARFNSREGFGYNQGTQVSPSASSVAAHQDRASAKRSR